ncbi:MAG: hypothetical protein HYZ48_00320 [Chlamydiales bacterium]|nr:hypothetical protein [Chlamydiales bacterium]
MEIKNKKCPCGSEKSYSNCCEPLHKGAPAKNALALMRSRYSAYALSLPDYILLTTHPQSPFFSKKISDWLKEIEDFSLNTSFEGLEILDFENQEATATVTFRVHLIQDKTEISFTEKSLFKKEKDRWLYLLPI